MEDPLRGRDAAHSDEEGNAPVRGGSRTTRRGSPVAASAATTATAAIATAIAAAAATAAGPAAAAAAAVAAAAATTVATAAAAAEAATTTASTAAAAAARRTLFSDVDTDVATVELLAVGRIASLDRHLLGGERYETEASGSVRLAIPNHLAISHFPELLEESTKAFIGRSPAKTTHKQLLGHLGLLPRSG
jgi:nucleoid-associated protein YgaU